MKSHKKTKSKFSYLCRVMIDGFSYSAYVTIDHNEFGLSVDDFYLLMDGTRNTELILNDYETEWMFCYLNQVLENV